ncbi:reverse transcriptase domain-containing protein [Tanacetum coccineum]|uniref:Reverse transcriptase domain-containing protein n=1 Tax=Tanacetum coccineum TaxID=301880 RepID=A0ABQ5HFT1_9ASTR
MWQQNRGKENEVNILKSIDEGPFQMGTFRETLAEGNKGVLHLGPERPRVYSDLSPKDKERYNDDIRATNTLLQGLPKDIYSLINHYTDVKDIWDNVKILLEGSELTKEDRESQLYDDFEHFCQHKGETIHDYYGRFVTAVKLNRGLRDSNYDQLYAYLKLHDAHANENKMMLERFTQPNVDPLALMSNVSHQQYNSQSSTNPSSTYVPPHFADNSQLDSGLSPTDNLIENLTNTLALLTQSYKTYLPQTNNQLRTSSNPRNQATVQDDKVVVQNVQGRQNRGHGNNARGAGTAGYGGAQNRVGNANPGQARQVKCYNCNADDCDAFDSDVDEAPTAQTMFMANLSSADPVYDEADPSYDSDALSEIHDNDHYQDAVCEHHEIYEMHDDVQPNYVVTHMLIIRVIVETDIQEQGQKESQKQAKPSTEWKGQSQKSSQCMRTRSQARRLRQQQRQQQQVPPNLVEPPKDTMADNRTMAELLQAPTEGYEDAIVVPEIAAANFEIKHGLLTLVQNKQFFGHDREDPHAHIRYFNKITSTLRYPNVPTTSIKLMLFPFSLEGAARIWLEKEPPRSIQTWDDLVAKFINQFFPPSKTTNLRNEITNFKQRFDESFSEAWDRFKDLLRACPHHGFSELHQLDTFYNALNVNDQDSLNSAAGGNFLDKRPADCSSIIESKSKVRHSRSKAIVAKVSTSASTSGVSPDVAELKDMVRALLLDKQTSPVPAPAPVKAVEQSCVTCGGAHSYRNCPATDSNNYRDNIQEYVSQAAAANFNQGNSGYRPPPMANQIRPPGFPPMQHNNQANNQNRWNQNQNRGNGYNQGQIQRPQVQQHAPMYQPPVNQHPAYQAPAHQASGIDDAECDLEKDILLLEAILNSEPLSPLPNHANYFPEG